jgi:hypothetical protein
MTVVWTATPKPIRCLKNTAFVVKLFNDLAVDWQAYNRQHALGWEQVRALSDDPLARRSRILRLLLGVAKQSAHKDHLTSLPRINFDNSVGLRILGRPTFPRLVTA